MADDVTKVGVDEAGDGGQQPEVDNTQDAEPGVEGAEPGVDPGADGAEPGVDGAESADGAEGAEKKKKDNGKVDFPIVDAQYRNEAGEVVSAASEPVANADGVSVVRLLAVPRPIFDEDADVNPETGKKPVLYHGWNHRKHNPLKKGDFEDESEFVNYQAFTFRIKAAVFMEKAKVAEKRAARLKKFGSNKQRKDVSRALKMQEQLAKYIKSLEDQGIDISALDD